MVGSDNLLDALSSGMYVTVETVKSDVEFSAILEDVVKLVDQKKTERSKTVSMGFIQKVIH